MTQEAAETKPAATKATAKKTPRPKALTLQQKFIKLREAIPAIVKAKHSEGVEYKFAKISDVYRLLTPAMNEHGVNFDMWPKPPPGTRRKEIPFTITITP